LLGRDTRVNSQKCWRGKKPHAVSLYAGAQGARPAGEVRALRDSTLSPGPHPKKDGRKLSSALAISILHLDVALLRRYGFKTRMSEVGERNGRVVERAASACHCRF
jgi:hypothetical protein